MLRASIVACLALAVVALPGGAQDRPDLTGTWKFDASKSQIHSEKINGGTWTISEGDDTIKISESEDGSNKKVEFQCTTDGKECKVTGDKASASFWYNGPMLVEMETRGDHVLRYRMKLSSDGKTLTVQTTSIVPQSSQDDTLVFDKQA
ncbi:MAG TPA: hypothetical protein VMH80_01395 [Bryobacteraceae bacterium]|nr:hypothetical protein [Bryobacteraceae bacterium]